MGCGGACAGGCGGSCSGGAAQGEKGAVLPLHKTLRRPSAPQPARPAPTRAERNMFDLASAGNRDPDIRNLLQRLLTLEEGSPPSEPQPEVKRARRRPRKSERLYADNSRSNRESVCALGNEPAQRKLGAAGNIPKGRRAEQDAPSALLLKAFSLPIPDDGNYAPCLFEALRRFRPESRQLLRPHPSAIEPDPKGVRLVPRMKPGPEVGAGPGHDDTIVPENGPIAVAIVGFTYRSVSFEVPGEWLDQYLLDWAHLYRNSERPEVDVDQRHGGVSSVTTALDMLWPQFRAQADGDMSVFHSMLACFNLPREPLGGEQFWKNGWGPAHKVYLYALQLIYSYVGYVEPEVSACNGFAYFIYKALQGHESTTSDDRKCTFKFNYRNAETYSHVNEPDSCSETKVQCNEGFNPKGEKEDCLGREWSSYDNDIAWVDYHSCWSGQGADDISCKGPAYTCESNGLGGGEFQSTFPPITQMYRGWLCDFLLYLARMAIDYGRSLPIGDLGTSLSVTLKAQHIARYALRVIAEHSLTIIHEMGHTYAGTKHCDGITCCFNIARNGWLCQLRARLGLPVGDCAPAGSRGYDDWDPDENVYFVSSDQCSSSDDDYYYMWWCTILPSQGRPNQTADFCSTTCIPAVGATSADIDWHCLGDGE